ncbi:hypothetical protein [Halalkalibacter alkalisediminis]|uniref:Uncharacterized protein n=1 Tax=Halalkalibacter alkalisediminis TaxID=935616 RepID=A0ABV6NE87_9BACI|nr:hypothetical protein [Halalkalibacter alkalisediminis]
MNKSIHQLVELDKQHFLHQTLPIQQQQQYSFQVTQAEKQFSSLWCVTVILWSLLSTPPVGTDGLRMDQSAAHIPFY